MGFTTEQELRKNMAVAKKSNSSHDEELKQKEDFYTFLYKLNYKIELGSE